MVKNPIISITGHRPSSLPNRYDMQGKDNKFLRYRLELAIKRLKPAILLTGMALGVDQWAAELAVRFKIPFIACIPFAGQETLWPPIAQRHYKKLLDKAWKIEIISDGHYEPWKMQKRNEHLVDSCDILLAVFNGDTDSGTGHCVRYAEQAGRPIEYIKFDKS
jgi:uncharacterized phage-like protein YoqJ